MSSSSSEQEFGITTTTNFKSVLLNTRLVPYKHSIDKLLIKLETYLNRKISYLEGLPYYLYLNYTGDWVLYVSGTTNKYRMDYIQYSTENITSISNCMGIAKVIYKGNVCWSNPVRFNFKGEDLIFSSSSSSSISSPSSLSSPADG